MDRLVVHPTLGPIAGTVQVPVSKYHLHRALILGSLAEGRTHVVGASRARHIGDTLRALSGLGTPVVTAPDGYWVYGGSYLPRRSLVSVGSSGSTLQFLLGLACQSFAGPVTFDGVEALRRRPIGPLLNALQELGIRLRATGDCLPVTVYPGLPEGGHVEVSGFLSQWVSALLMVAPLALHPTVLEVRPPHNERTYVRLTVDMLRRFGITVESDAAGTRWHIPAQQTFRPATVRIEADLSSAAFPLAMAALHPGEVTLTGLAGPGDHPEGRILDILDEMGGGRLRLIRDPDRNQIRIANPGARLQAIRVDMTDIPDLLPILTVLAALAHGKSVLTGVEPARYKESNRVRAMLQLRKMGARIEDFGDRLEIIGTDRLQGADLSSFNDHRVLMALTVAGSRAAGETRLTFPHAYRISYPEFLDDLRTLGLAAEVAGRTPAEVGA